MLLHSPADIHVQTEVPSTERKSPHSMGCVCNVFYRGQAFTRLDDWNQVNHSRIKSLIALELSDQPIDGRKLIGGLDFWQNNAVQPVTHHCLDVTKTIGGIVCINPDIAFASPGSN